MLLHWEMGYRNKQIFQQRSSDQIEAKTLLKNKFSVESGNKIIHLNTTQGQILLSPSKPTKRVFLGNAWGLFQQQVYSDLCITLQSKHWNPLKSGAWTAAKRGAEMTIMKPRLFKNEPKICLSLFSSKTNMSLFFSQSQKKDACAMTAKRSKYQYLETKTSGTIKICIGI